MPIMIKPAQYAALEAQQLRTFAAEVARTLSAIPSNHATPSTPGGPVEFAHEQVQRASRLGLKRRNEMMAWALCAWVHGTDFDHRMPEIRQIVAEPNYDRSMMLTVVAMHGLRGEGQAA
ncbi:MAG TPA: hypothetical protein VF453_12060 [Burkholderiaceae bacterium]